jgi:hypothetical protein
MLNRLVGRGKAPLSNASLRGVAASGNSPQVQQFFDRLSILPDSTRQILYINLINGLVSDGVWSLLDVLCLISQTQQLTLTNLVNNTIIPSLVGSPTFVVDRYNQMNGINYILTGFNPSTVSQNFTQNSAFSAACEINTTLGNAASFRSVPDSGNITELWPKYSNGNTLFGLNGAEQQLPNPGDTSGIYVVSRTASNNINVYRNGTLLGSSNSASGVPENNIITVGFGGGNPKSAMFAFGGSLDTTKANAFYNRINTYLTAIGAI